MKKTRGFASGFCTVVVGGRTLINTKRRMLCRNFPRSVLVVEDEGDRTKRKPYGLLTDTLAKRVVAPPLA